MKTRVSSRRHHFSVNVSTLLASLVLIAGMIGCDPVCENLQIQTWYDLDDIRSNLGCNHILMNDLDSTTPGYADLASLTANAGEGWKPIGAGGNPFKGTFDGGGHTISDLFIYRPDEDEVGLFGRVQEGLIENLGLVSVNVTGRKSVGALVGYNWKGTLNSDTGPPYSRTYSYGSVTGEEDVGGLVGNNYGGIVNQCESSAEVFHLLSTPDEECWRAGGLVGLNSGPVLNCNYNGEVNGDRQVGGLVGHNALAPDGRVEDCGGAYSVNGTSVVGGVAGLNLGALRRNSYAGEVNGILTVISYGLMALDEGGNGNAHFTDTALPGSYIGGVVGFSSGTVEYCSAQATVRGHQYVGGAIGGNQGIVTGCSSDSSVTGETDAGQLVGHNMGTGTVSNSSSTSCVTGTSDCGPLVGWNEGTIEEGEEEPPTEVRLGTVLPITGIFAAWGQQEFGMRKAVDDQNALGGVYLSEWDVTVPVRLIIKDGESGFDKVGPLSTDLAVTDEVHAFLSPAAPAGLHSSTSVVANQHGVPQIIGGGPFEPWDIAIRAGEDWPYSWFSGFSVEARSAHPRDVDGYTLVDTYFSYMDRVDARANTNMITGVFGSDDGDGRGFYDGFPGLMEDYGMTVIGAEEELGLFPMDTTDFTPMIQAWQDAGVEIVWGSCFAPHFGMLLSQCYEAGFRPKICLTHRAAMFAVDVISWGTDPPSGWGVGAEVWWSPHYAAADGFVGIGDRTATSLAEDWATETGEPLNQFIGLGYMAAQVMLDAIERAGDVDGDAINDALVATDLDTINGWVKFDSETHFSPQPLSVGQWFYDEENEDEPFTLYVVASALDFIPEEADLVFPKPW